ncbi:alpha-glucosidase/alpha-galactosidase [Roseibium sp. SCP14]|uniref:alpha-glucosidase/alpha-galactosidase n=1 Tax=Roseibium sp. SCP14 TaxID=3141375 RepID=UPI003338DEAF
MVHFPKIAFIGAGSTVFMKNIVGDILHRRALRGAHVALMDLNEKRLQESEVVANRMVTSLDVPARITTHLNQREALDGADFVVVAFQVGGYDPCTITDFEVPKEFGLRQTIADTLGVGGIMRGVRTVPHLWSVCEDMLEVCPDATLLQYVNPMAINIWAITRKYPKIKQVGLCHSVQHTARTLAVDLGIDPKDMHYRCAGINHIAFFLHLHKVEANGQYTDLYPALRDGYANGEFPTGKAQENPRCPNIVRYEILKQFGYFVTESSEHFSEYVPWFIKEGREDLIERFQIPLDEYPTRCIQQIERWHEESSELMNNERIEVEQTDEYASEIINSIWTGEPSVIYGNVANTGLITNLPHGCAVEVPCLVDRNGVQPTFVGDIPPQLAAIMQSNVTAQGLTVDALMNEDPELITHAAMMDPHTAAELDLDQIRAMVLRLRQAHGEWLPEWARA